MIIFIRRNRFVIMGKVAQVREEISRLSRQFGTLGELLQHHLD